MTMVTNDVIFIFIFGNCTPECIAYESIQGVLTPCPTECSLSTLENIIKLLRISDKDAVVTCSFQGLSGEQRCACLWPCLCLRNKLAPWLFVAAVKIN